MAKKRKKAKLTGCKVKTVKFKGKESGTARKSEISFEARVGPSCKPKAHAKSASFKAHQRAMSRATKACGRGKDSKREFFPKKGTQTPFNRCVSEWFADNLKK